MNNINKQLVRSFADAGNQNDLDAFDSILAQDFRRHCEATPEVTVKRDPWGRSLQAVKKWCQIVPGCSGSRTVRSLNSG